MRRVDQTIYVGDSRGRPGNCVSAAVATVLDLPLDAVPHFIEVGIGYGDTDNAGTAGGVSEGNAWWALLVGFVIGHGRWLVELDHLTDAEPGELLLVAGMSPRGVLHQVVYRDGKLWHDPHPSRDGVLDVREILAVRPLAHPFDHTPDPHRDTR